MSSLSNYSNILTENKPSEQKFRDLDLSVAEDLNTFLISAEGVVADAGHFSNAAETEHYHRLNAEGIKGEEVFKVLVNKLSLIRALAKELQNVYIANDREIPDHKVEEIQSTYNELITLRNYISQTYLSEDKPETPEVFELAPEPAAIRVTEVSLNTEEDDYLPSRFTKRKTMEIESENEEASLPLYVAEETEKAIVSRLGRPSINSRSSSLVVGDDLNYSENSVVAVTEARDPINRAIINLSPLVPPHEIVLTVDSVLKKLLRNREYQSFITERYPSERDFAKVINNKVAQIEARTTDSFERWLGEKSSSAFRYLENKTIDEISELMSRKDVRSILTKRNVKYETFLTWIDLITEMQGLMQINEDITLLELFARGLIESEMQDLRHK